MAAAMIRDEAKRRGSVGANEKLARIRKALGVVLRRYGCARQQRRDLVDGEQL
jgi:hypothetical protein